jgi:putative tryptophan/tyrosine transport system substrate-binding protein
MRRRRFIALLGGTAAAWPLAVRAQQGQRVRRIGVLTNLAENDPETRLRLDAFLLGLQQLGWKEGRNLRIDYRWGVGDTDSHRKNAAELVALAPDVILAHGSTIMGPLQQATHSVPIVFVSVSDPVAGGFVASLARPSGNATGFTSFEYGNSGKWLEMLKEIAPDVTRAAVIRDPEQVSGGGQIGALQAVAATLRIELNPIGMRDMSEIARAIAAFAGRPNGGLIVTTAAWAQIHRDELIALAARHRLPAMYPYRLFVTAGGLSCYSPDIVHEYREAAGYVDRILKGENPGDLPVQAPTKYTLAINLRTAKAIGLVVPAGVLARADEVIE